MYYRLYISNELLRGQWNMYKRVKISSEAHEILKKYCKKHGRTMKWVLENFISKELQEQSFGVKLKVDRNDKNT